MTPPELFAEVATRAPSFNFFVEEHLRDHDGLLPHLLMSDLLRFVGSHYVPLSHTQAVPPTAAEVREILAILDREVVGGDPATENAIAVSFVENLEAEPFFAPLLGAFGPNLRRQHGNMAWSNAG